MIFNLIHILLAALGLGFLIFIHELGHYLMARRAGMTVEIFSIGFGKPLYSWQYQGVKWQLCYLPFGGYVRIAGMEKKGQLEPYEIPDGFYGKSPWKRIQVAVIGPLVNILFALLAFCALWVLGGREKPFSENTGIIGWVDPCSTLYVDGVRPGDQITELNQKPFRSFQDLLYAAMLNDKSPNISGYKIDYFTQDKRPFTYTFPLDSQVKGMERLQALIGTWAPAGYLISTQGEETLAEGSPMKHSGIRTGDRLVWADGKLLFSKEELMSVLNASKVLLTVKRNAEIFLTRVPRLKISDLRIQSAEKAEIEDWQDAGGIKGRLQDLYFIPYLLSDQNVVEGRLSFLNAESREESPCAESRLEEAAALNVGDHILAVDGIPAASTIELLKNLQTRHVQIIVQNAEKEPMPSWKEADQQFACDIPWQDLQKMVCCIGLDTAHTQVGKLRLLAPVEPKRLAELPLAQEMRKKIDSNLNAEKKAIDEIKDSQQKAEREVQLEQSQRQLMLGIGLSDRGVDYNPSPFALFTRVLSDTWRTLLALVTGILSPKWLAGPIGMVQVMQKSWTVGAKEALYWLAVISMNLGIMNLLPIPVLDGGHISFSLWEAVTKRRIKAKTMERLIIPFILLLIVLFVYLTYHDIVRLITQFL